MIAGAFAGVAIGAIFKDMVSAASDAEQSLGATEAIFGKFADTVVKTSDEAATKFGLSANSYRENANQLGAVLGNLGVSQDQLAGKTEGLIGLGADLSAMFGGTTKSAVEALTAAYKGEYEQMERYGVSIKASDVAARLAAEGKDKLTGASLKQAQQEAVSALIMEQTAKAQGAFARESDTLAQKQQVLAAKIENVKTKVGSLFLPILVKLATYVSDTLLPKLEEFGRWASENILPKIESLGNKLQSTLVPAIKQMGDFLANDVVPALQDFGTWVQNNRAWLEPLTVAILAMVAAAKLALVIQSVVTAIKAFSMAAQLATIKTWLLNFALLANPFVLIGLLIVGLVAAFVYLWKTNDGFREAVIRVWNAIKGAVGAVVEWFKTAIPAAWEWVKEKTTSVWESVKTFITDTWNTITESLTAAWDGIKSAATTAWNAIKDFISGAFQFILNAWLQYTPMGIIISNWETIKAKVTAAVTAVKDFVTKGWNAIKTSTTNAWNAVKTAVQNVWDNVKSAVSNAINSVKNTVSNGWNTVKNASTTAWNAVKDGISRVWDGIKTAVSNAINSVMRTVEGIKSRITGYFSGAASWLLSAGRNILQGLINGITEKIGQVREKLQGVTNLIPDWKGPAKRDKKLLYSAGQLIMQGLIGGISSEERDLKRKLNHVTDIIEGTQFVPKGFAIDIAARPVAGVVGAYGNAQHTTINVNVNVPPTADKAAIGREIQGALDAWVRINGS